MIHSCGIIPVYNYHQTLRYLLVQHQHGHHWGFPKGHVDAGETDEQTARRELREEAGITRIQIISGYVSKDRYIVQTPIGKKSKQVTYFIGVVRDQKFVPQPGEISDAHWFDYHSARLVLANPSAKKVLQRANIFLTTHPRYWRMAT